MKNLQHPFVLICSHPPTTHAMASIDCLEKFSTPSTIVSQPPRRGGDQGKQCLKLGKDAFSHLNNWHTDDKNITLVRSLSLFTTCLCFTYLCFCFALQDKGNWDESALPGNTLLDTLDKVFFVSFYKNVDR